MQNNSRVLRAVLAGIIGCSATPAAVHAQTSTYDFNNVKVWGFTIGGWSGTGGFGGIGGSGWGGGGVDR